MDFLLVDEHFWKRKGLAMQTIIEIRSHFGGWKVFEAQGIEPYFTEREQALHYATSRTALRRGEIGF